MGISRNALGVSATDALKNMQHWFSPEAQVPEYVDMHVVGESIPRRVFAGYRLTYPAPTELATCFYCGTRRRDLGIKCVNCGANRTKS